VRSWMEPVRTMANYERRLNRCSPLTWMPGGFRKVPGGTVADAGVESQTIGSYRLLRRLGVGPEHRDTLAASSALGHCVEHEGHLPDAEKIDLAEIYQAQKRYAEAISFYRQALDSERKSLGPSHP
jgi:tetratricopeptide (TPR) repeat protein